MSSIQVQVYFRGRVQGVGFRYQILQIAKGFSVTGYVRNLNDGCVELCTQGEKAELELFIKEIQTQWVEYVYESEIHYSEITNSLEGFKIRH